MSKLDFHCFEQYILEVMRWNKKINLMSRSDHDLRPLLVRHIKDSLGLLPYIKDQGPILDFGSGAGLPGGVLAIAGCKNMNLVERNFKKASFLRHIVSLYDLHTDVIADDICNISGENYKCIISKAVTDAATLIRVSQHVSDKNTMFFLLKSQGQQQEIENLQQYCEFQLDIYDNEFYNEGQIWKITDVRRCYEE